jgi:hypothetical protein
LLPWIKKGTLPTGSILRSFSVNARLDSQFPGSDSWADDLAPYVDPYPQGPGTNALLQVGGYNAIGTVGTRVAWGTGQASPPSPLVATKTEADWNPTTGDIDLNTVQLSLGNGYSVATWSGTITVGFDPIPATFLEFGLPGNLAVYTGPNTLTWTVPYGSVLATLAPNYKLSSGTCDKASGSTRDFTTPQTYTVIFGAITNVYTVTVAVAAPPILVGASGVGPLTFGALPPKSEWSTLTAGGGSGYPSSDATMDSYMSAIGASSINAELFSTNNNTANGKAIWRSDVLTLFTRPTGNAMTLLMATLRNVSGSTIATLSVSYTLTAESTTPPVEEVPGHRVYWSKTGAAGSWVALGDYAVVTGSATISFNLPGIAWANGETLYVVWADDNAAGTDGRYRLDNMTFGPAQPPPPVITGSDVTYPAGGSPTVQVQNSAVGVKYTLVYKNGVTDPDWTTLPEASANKTGDGGTISLIDTSPSQATAPHRFYRVWAHY